MKGTYLITEFRDKDAVKSLGARWDPLRRQVVRTPRNRSSGLCQLAARCRSGLYFGDSSNPPVSPRRTHLSRHPWMWAWEVNIC